MPHAVWPVISRAAAVAMLLIAPFGAAGSPRPPPSPDFEKFLQQSCEGPSVAAQTASVPVTVTHLKPEHAHAAGQLRWRWGVRIASKDPRLSFIVGLELDERYGILAATRGGNWLSFDLQHASLDAVTSVGIMPMAGAPGRPEALTSGYKSMLVSFPDQHVVSLFATDRCGTAAKALPLITVAGEPRAQTMTVAGYPDVGLVGQEKDGAVRNALVVSTQTQTVRLDHSDLRPLAGYRLQALTNPSKIVPYVVAAWTRRGAAAETVIRQSYVMPWGDVWGSGPAPPPIELGRLRRPIRALASLYDRSSRESWLFMAEESREPGVVMLYAFTVPGPL